jgi:hypothetical protein
LHCFIRRPLLLALSSAAFSSNYLLQAKHRSRLRIGNLDSKLGRMQSKFPGATVVINLALYGKESDKPIVGVSLKSLAPLRL